MNKTRLAILALVVGQVACAIADSALPATVTGITPPSTPTALPSAVDVCDWFLQTQILRTRRLVGLTEFLDWYQTHAAEGFDAVTISDSEELIRILERYQPYQEEFVQSWLKLGPIPEGEDFWQNELASVQLRIEAFDNLIRGYEAADVSMITRGADLFEQSQQAGIEGESAMLQVRSRCTGQ